MNRFDMEKQYKYTLQKGSAKSICPSCGKKTLVRYVDSVTGECLPEHYGRCDREINCGYINTPKPEPQASKAYFVPFDKFVNYSDKSYLLEQAGKRFYIPKKMVVEVAAKGCYILEWYLNNTDKKPIYNNGIEKTFEVAFITQPPTPGKAKPEPQQQTPIPFEVLAATLGHYDKNVFVQNLLSRVEYPFEAADIEAVVEQYYLGTVASFGGAVALPYIDKQNTIRAIQVKQFDEANHTTKTSFLHGILKHQYQQRGEALPDWLPAYEANELKVSCMFGEHLLSKYPLNPVALVEAPKSAIYGTLYFGLPNVPDRFLWLAVYNLSSLNVDKCKALEGRQVVLFPDLSKDGKAFELWNSKLKELNTIKGARFTISGLLESKASEAERLSGCDIADYLITKDWRLFRDSEKSEKSESENNVFVTPPQNIVDPGQTKIEQPSEKSEKSESENNDFFIDFLDFSDIENSEPKVYKPAVDFPSFISEPKENWSAQILELENFFATARLPAEPVQLDVCSKIVDVNLFIESHLATVKANNGVLSFLPYLNRLQTFKNII